MTQLRPKTSADYRSVAEIVERADNEFAFVQCDAERGLQYAAERLLKAGANLSHDEKDHSMSLVADTIEMILGNDRRRDRHFLKCFVIPNGPIEVVYLYDSHARNTRSLLTRLADALEYGIHID